MKNDRTKLRPYWTGLRSSNGEWQQNPKASRLYRGPGWEIRFLPYQPKYPEVSTRQRRKLLLYAGPKHELQILARSLTAAAYVATLLYAARSLLEGLPVERILSGWEPYQAVPLDERELEDLPPTTQRSALEAHRSRFYIEGNGFFDAAQIACTLARRRHLRNAALKLLLSTHLTEVHHLDLRPGAHEATAFRSPHPIDWVWFSQSLFSAYGVVEELRLAPKATASRPSLLPDGSWNPEVRKDLETRLERIGIHPGDTLYWHARGRPRRLEKKALQRITNSKPTRWTRGEVRDADILYIDAINIANYLRSNVTAHVGDMEGLSAIDVANVQQLGRLLLLHAVRFHFWDHMKSGWGASASVELCAPGTPATQR